MKYKFVDDISNAYVSGANNQFILHGNIDDKFLINTKDSLPKLVNLVDFLNNELFGTFDVVIHYDVGFGVKILKGELHTTTSQNQSFFSKEHDPFVSIPEIGKYIAFCCHPKIVSKNIKVAIVVTSIDLIIPNVQNGVDHKQAAIISQMRDWASDPKIGSHNIVSFLITPSINSINTVISKNSKSLGVKVPLPDKIHISVLLDIFKYQYQNALPNIHGKVEVFASGFLGSTLSSIDNMIKIKNHLKEEIREEDLDEIKKNTISQDCGELLEVISSKKTLKDYYGNDTLVTWLKQDIELIKKNDTIACPMGYLLSGPVGTGKTYLVECLAGEAGIPVVKLKNFRDKWQGSTESNLEKIFSVIESMNRVFVFVDEADQNLGKRDSSSSSDGGLSGRIYAMFAEKMSNPKNRGKIIWILATSRPDLVEVDLKRPGRIDVKIPIFPTLTNDESWSLIKNISRKNNFFIEDGPDLVTVKLLLPIYLTPGAVDSLIMTAYRLSKIKNLIPYDAIRVVLENWAPPVKTSVIEEQITYAVNECTHRDFIPDSYLKLKQGGD